MATLPFTMPPEPPRPAANEDNQGVIQRWAEWAHLSIALESLRLRQDAAAGGGAIPGMSVELAVMLQVFAAHLQGDPTPNMADVVQQTKDLIAEAAELEAAAPQ